MVARPAPGELPRRRSCINAAVLCLFASAGPASAQDSVASVPGGNDALSAHAGQSVRYVLDLAPITSSWGNEFAVGPVFKATRDPDPLFNTRFVVGVTVSADQRYGVEIEPTQFALWNTPGAGVHPTANSRPLFTIASRFDRRFALAFADLSREGGAVVGARVGRMIDDPTRLYVERTVGAVSRPTESMGDCSSLSLGTIDAGGVVAARVDDFQAPGSPMGDPVDGDSVACIDLTIRTDSPNWLMSSADGNVGADAPATAFVLNAAEFSAMPPVILPSTVTPSGSPRMIVADFAGRVSVGQNTPTSSHLGEGLAGHRGAPSFARVGAPGAPVAPNNPAGAIGCLASLAIGPGDAAPRHLNLALMDQTGAFVSARSLALPASLSDGAWASVNASFLQGGSQLAFRGGSGPVAFGSDATGAAVVAATATDAVAGDFIAVARLPQGVAGAAAPEWSVAARVGSRVLNGSGSQIGLIVEGSPAPGRPPITLSAPAVDLLGNVYFVGWYKPNLGSPRVALFKAVKTVQGYRLERLLQVGQIVGGLNSGRSYEISALTLADADSVASGGLFSSSVLQARLPGSPPDPADPRAFGGVVVGAVLLYDNDAALEAYDAVLFVGPREGGQTQAGDLNTDGLVNGPDLAILLGDWGASGSPADLNGDGTVDGADLAVLLGSWSL